MDRIQLIREGYARICAEAEGRALRWGRQSFALGADEVQRAELRLLGAYELALAAGVDPGESPTAWCMRVLEQIRRAA